MYMSPEPRAGPAQKTLNKDVVNERGCVYLFIPRRLFILLQFSLCGEDTKVSKTVCPSEGGIPGETDVKQPS